MKMTIPCPQMNLDKLYTKNSFVIQLETFDLRTFNSPFFLFQLLMDVDAINPLGNKHVCG
jgi:hypothetical protein